MKSIWLLIEIGYDIKLFQLWSNIVKNALEAMADQKDRYLGVFAERKKESKMKTMDQRFQMKLQTQFSTSFTLLNQRKVDQDS